MLTSCWKSIYTFIFMKDLRLDLKDLGFEQKWGFEIWLNDLNTFLERFKIWVWDLPITVNGAYVSRHYERQQIVTATLTNKREKLRQSQK